MPTLKATKTEARTSMGETKTRRELFAEARKLFDSANGMTQSEYADAIEAAAETGKRHAGMLAKQIDRLINNLANSDESGSVINSSCGSVDGVTDRTAFHFVEWLRPIVDAEPMPVTETVLGDDENGRYRVRNDRPIRCEPFEVIHENLTTKTVESVPFEIADWSHEQIVDALHLAESYPDRFSEADISKLRRMAGFREPYSMADSMPVDTPASEPRAFSVGQNTGGAVRYLSSDDVAGESFIPPLYGQGEFDAVAWLRHWVSRSGKSETDREPIGHIGYVGPDARIVQFD